MTRSSIITLLTDFGRIDSFVGTMKGVILNIFPQAKLVDITHDIEPQNIPAAAFNIFNSFRFFPEGTVHTVIVDPGVGTERRIVCSEISGHVFLAPDNGVLQYIYKNASEPRVINVTNTDFFLPQISNTFHGRDIFAPVAAHLANGVALDELGDEIADYIHGEVPLPVEHAKKIKGNIIYIDRFGNLISNIAAEKVEAGIQRIEIKNYTINGLANSYGRGSAHEPIALIGSSGFLEIAVNLNSAKALLNCEIGEVITVILN